MSVRELLARLRDDPTQAWRPTGRGMPPARHVEPTLHEHEYAQAVRILRDGPVDLLPPVTGQSERERLRIAVVVPPFHFGSGGHDVLFQLISRWERSGHTCSPATPRPSRLVVRIRTAGHSRRIRSVNPVPTWPA